MASACPQIVLLAPIVGKHKNIPAAHNEINFDWRRSCTILYSVKAFTKSSVMEISLIAITLGTGINVMKDNRYVYGGV